MADYYFSLPPEGELTLDQRSALNEPNPIALSGGPGTGKSVVSLYRHLNLNQNGKNCQLLTYTTSLAIYLRSCAANINSAAGNNISSSYKWMNNPSNYGEIIVDEAQDMPENFHNRLKTYSDRISYGADDAQILYPARSTNQNTLNEIFNNRKYILKRNFRSTKKIMLFAKEAFPNARIDVETINNIKEEGVTPRLLVSNGSNYETSNEKQDKTIIDLIRQLTKETTNIAILSPWKKHVEYFYKMAKSEYKDCTYYYEDQTVFPDGCEEISNVHFTTFKSSKGLEFDVVIIPNFHRMQEANGNFNVDWQDYYVGITRAKTNLFLISNNEMRSLNLVSDKVIL